MAEPQAVKTDGAPEGKKGGVLPLLAAFLVTLGAGGAVGQKVVGPMMGTNLADKVEAAEEAAAGDAHAAPAPSAMHVVDNLVVNPAGSGGSRFLLTSVAVEAATPEATAQLAGRDVEIRHAFTLVLGARTVEALTDMTQREALIQDLAGAVESVLGPGTVRRVLIPQFVIQ